DFLVGRIPLTLLLRLAWHSGRRGISTSPPDVSRHGVSAQGHGQDSENATRTATWKYTNRSSRWEHCENDSIFSGETRKTKGETNAGSRNRLSADNQVGGAVEVEALARRDYSCCAVFGDDGGAGVILARLESVAGVDRCGEFLAVEEDWASGRGNRAELCSAWTLRLRSGQAHEGGRSHTGFSSNGSARNGSGGFYRR